MQTRKEGSIRRVLVVMAIFALAMLTLPQAQAQDEELPAPRAEVFVGYSWLHPGAPSVSGFPTSIDKGFNAAVTWNFNKYWGLTFDTSGHWDDDMNVAHFAGGPTFKYPVSHFVPFGHVLVGVQKMSPFDQDETDFAAIVGGGIDVRFTKMFSWRVIQADWIPTAHAFAVPPVHHDEFQGARLSSGIVLNFGQLEAPIPPSATCSANPAQVMEGEPVTITATPKDFNPKHDLNYEWKTTGGQASGTGATVQIDTKGMAGGNYTASAHITDPRSKKAMADCSANFTVQERPKNPPQISCSANPATVQSGQPSTISCTCTSPDNAELQPLAWSSSGGNVTGQGNNATLSTEGAGAGTITVTATCTDARGLSSSGTANVNVEVPQKVEASKINECSFPNKAKPARVDNACKAALDDVALRLQRDADAKAVIVGQMDANEKPKNVAAQRALNTKDYLVKEKQIDESRLETRSGSDGGQRVEIYLVPAGATFDEANTTPVTAPAKKAPAKKKR